MKEHLAFRGGTALHKIFFQPPGRYSEDIDLCRTGTGPVGDLVTHLRKNLDPWLGKPRYEKTQRAVTLKYHFQTESNPQVSNKFKIEINVREHYNLLGLKSINHAVTNPWFTGQAEITTYSLEELLATKLRALYQRRKGRDLFDLYMALIQIPKLNVGQIVEGFAYYMERMKLSVSRAEFETNLDQKGSNNAFRSDITNLLPSGIDGFDFDTALLRVREEIIAKLP